MEEPQSETQSKALTPAQQELLTQKELILQLDPQRDYGELTYEDVKTHVLSGQLVLKPGHTVPIISDAFTGKRVKGSGRPIHQDHMTRKQEMAAMFSAKAAEEFDEFWAYFWKTVKEGDPRAHKLFLEYAVGRPGMATGGGEANLFKMLLEKALEPTEATVKHIHVNEHEGDVLDG